MLNIKFVLQNKDLVVNNCINRGGDHTIITAALLRYEQRRRIQQELTLLRNQHKTVRNRMKKFDENSKEELALLLESTSLSERIEVLGEKIEFADAQIEEMLRKLPDFSE